MGVILFSKNLNRRPTEVVQIMILRLQQACWSTLRKVEEEIPPFSELLTEISKNVKMKRKEYSDKMKKLRAEKKKKKEEEKQKVKVRKLKNCSWEKSTNNGSSFAIHSSK